MGKWDEKQRRGGRIKRSGCGAGWVEGAKGRKGGRRIRLDQCSGLFKSLISSSNSMQGQISCVDGFNL